jgi:hypothetical protein
MKAKNIYVDLVIKNLFLHVAVVDIGEDHIPIHYKKKFYAKFVV